MSVNEDKLDWSQALPYRKSSTLLATNVRTADGAEKVVTLNSEGAVEREGITKAGDKVITDNRGQPYIIVQEKFGTLYEIDPASPNQFRSKNNGIAFQTQEPLTILRKDGKEVSAAAGDYVFHSNMTDTVNVVAQAEFEKTYRPDVMDGRESRPAARPTPR